MAKKSVNARRNSLNKVKNVSNPFKRVELKNPISNVRWSANAVFFGLLVILILLGALTGNTYFSGNRITGSAISDITGAQTGITPVIDMLKDLVKGILGYEGIFAVIFTNLFSAGSWLPSVAVFMIMSGFFYFGLRKTLLHDDSHKKLATFMAIGLGLLSIGITINGQNLVRWFEGLIQSAIVFLTLIIIGFMIWILTLKGMSHSSSVLREAHSAAAERIQERRGQLSQREEKRSEKALRKQQQTLRNQQQQYNRILAEYRVKYRDAKISDERVSNDRSREKLAKVDREFRAAVADSCPDLDQGKIAREWEKVKRAP